MSIGERDKVVIGTDSGDSPTQVSPISPDVQVGIPFGPWTLKERLGTGNSEVWRAYGPDFGEVALKILTGTQIATSGDPNAGERFTGEFTIMRSLAHPHIVPVYAYGTEAQSAWFAMQLIIGKSLADIMRDELQEGRTAVVPLQAACSVTMQIAAALSYAHEHGVIHRDIKPHNIMLEGGMRLTRALLADFGIARMVSDVHLTRTGRVVGTPVYMSPEQCSGDRDVTPASDVYSLACVLYHMLAGIAPFRGSSADQLMHQHIYRTPPVISNNPQVNDALMAIIYQGMAKLPEQRFASAREFAARLQPFS